MTTKRLFRIAALGTAAFCLSLLAACQSSTVDKFPDPGHVNAHVSDQTGVAVAGATVELWFSDNSLVWRSAVTDASGNAVPGAADGGILPGNYNAKVTAPSGYTVPNTQQNPIAITVQSNKTVNLSFNLAKGP